MGVFRSICVGLHSKSNTSSVQEIDIVEISGIVEEITTKRWQTQKVTQKKPEPANETIESQKNRNAFVIIIIGAHTQIR